MVSKHLLINGVATNWRLPAETDVDALHERIRSAMREGAVIEVEGELGDAPLERTSMLLNGRAIATANVVELSEPGPR